MGRTRVNTKLSKAHLKHFHERKHRSEKRKNELIKYLEKLKKAYSEGIIPYSRYIEIIHHKKQGRTIEEWIHYYHLEALETHKKLQKHIHHITKKRFAVYIATLIVGIVLFSLVFNNSRFAGFVAQDSQEDSSPSQDFSEQLNLSYSKSNTYTWTPENSGNLNFVSLYGTIEGTKNSKVKIYLDNHLILDSSNIKSTKKGILTAMAIDETPDEETEEEPTPEEEEEIIEEPNNLKVTRGPEEPKGPEEPQEEESQSESVEEVFEEDSSPSQEESLPQSENEENITETIDIPSDSNETEEVAPEDSSPSQKPYSDKIIKEFENFCQDTCDLRDLNLNKDSYEIKIEITGDAEINIDKIKYGIISQTTSESIKENQTETLETPSTNATITTIQERAVIGQPVKWKKNIELEKIAPITINLPAKAENITAYKIEEPTTRGITEDKKTKVSLTGKVISSPEGKGIITRFWNFLKRTLGAMTGRVISEDIEITLDDNSKKYEVEYFTEAPQIQEEEIPNGKRITITGPDELHYQNILAFTTLEELESNSIIIYHIVEGKKVPIKFNASDTNNNSLIDYIEWNVPHLSEQVYEIIIINLCWAENNDAMGTWPDTCDGTYPSACGPTGDLLSCDDGNSETHSFGKGTKYGGVRTQQYNTSVIDCRNITKVELCYEWWADATATTCDISVDADGGTSYTAVTTTCPGTTANPGVTCTEITSLENWNCSSFFGTTGTRAEAKSEIISTTNNHLATWDVLYFNVSFADNSTPNSITNLNNQSNGATWIYWNWTNPTDTDFYQNIIYLNGTNIANTSNNYYNATSLNPSTNYTITVHTKDNGGNINNTDVNNSVLTTTSAAPTSNHPSDQTADIGEKTTIEWIIQDEGAPGYYYVERNGSLFTPPTLWQNNTATIIIPNTYFLGTWNYTIYFNDSSGSNGDPDTVLINILDETTPSCSELESSSAPSQVNITIDGEFNDWDGVIANSANFVDDLPYGAGDTDTIQAASKDLTGFAYTWDDNFLFFYFNRLYSGTNQVSMIAYLDYDNDNYMNSTDKVIRFSWGGSNRKYDATLYNYVPDSGTPDYMNGSGHTLPGTVTINKSIGGGIIGGSESGLKLEGNVSWSDLSLPGPQSMVFQAASSLGSNLPGQIEDNIDTISNAHSAILFKPNHTSSAQNGSTIYYNHDLMNCGLDLELITLQNSSTEAWNTTLYFANGTEITDSNSDGFQDVTLDSEEFTTIIIKINVPPTASAGTLDSTSIEASSQITSSTNKTVYDNTSIGAISITPTTRQIYVSESMTASFNYTITNSQGFNDTLDFTNTSTQIWQTNLYYANGTDLTDTDGDGIIDIHLLPSESKDILIKILVPSNEPLDTIDITTIEINSSIDPNLNSLTEINSTVKDRIIELTPDYNKSVGIGDATFYKIIIINNWNETDVIDINYTSTLGYDTTFYENDMLTPLTDTDGDGIIDIGNLSGYGAQANIYVKIIIPANATEGQQENTTIFGYSSLNTSVYGSVTVITTTRTIITYLDAGYSTEQDTFIRNQTVYVQSHNLIAINNIYYQWLNPDGILMRTSPSTPVTAEDTAEDQYTTNATDIFGNWTIILFNDQGDTEISRTIFYLIDAIPPHIILNYPENNSVDVDGNITFNCSATDDINLTKMELYINGTLNQTQNITGTENTTIFNTSLNNGTYNWTCRAYDANNHNESTRILIVSPPPHILVSPIANVNPIEANSKAVEFFSTMCIEAGVNYLNDSSLQANFTRPGQDTRENISCSHISDINSTCANYTCTIDMWYWDEAGNWNITVYGEDSSSNPAINTSTYFQYNFLQALVISENNLTFSADSGEINVTADNDPLTINNTGNANLSERITINATNLLGEINPNELIYAENFSVSITSGQECIGDSLQNATAVNITGVQLEAGNLSEGAGQAQEELFYCIKETPFISSQAYSTQGYGSWIIKIVFSMVLVLRKGSKNKKRKVILDELSIPITIFTNKLGGLEGIAKYLKENLALTYHEIALLLNRNDRTIWTSYNKAQKKQLTKLIIKRTLVHIPSSIFKNRKLTILEAMVVYLKDKGMKYVEIAEALNRDQRNIWTIYNRAIKK